MIYLISFNSHQKHIITNMPIQPPKLHIILITTNNFKEKNHKNYQKLQRKRSYVKTLYLPQLHSCRDEACLMRRGAQG